MHLSYAEERRGDSRMNMAVSHIESDLAPDDLRPMTKAL